MSQSWKVDLRPPTRAIPFGSVPDSPPQERSRPAGGRAGEKCRSPQPQPRTRHRRTSGRTRTQSQAMIDPGRRHGQNPRTKCITGDRLATHVLTGSPGLGKTRHGVAPDGAACRCGRRGLGPEATQAAPRSSRQSGLIAVVPIVTHTPTPPHVAFFRAPMDDSSHEKGTVPFFKGLMLSASHTTPLVRRRLHRRTARDVRHSE